MAEKKGHTTGFDYLRIILALLVAVSHATIISADNIDLFQTPLRIPFATVLPAFFALSGFLVSGSMLRNTVPQFVALRALRIVPALAVEVTLCALVLGPVFTTLPLAGYYADPMFHHYFLNVLGIIHLTLPGVFGGVQINSQLMTIPVELDCYLVLVVIAMLGLINRRWVFLALVASACIVLTYFAVTHGLIKQNHPLTGRVLIISFLSGCLVYYFRDRLPFHPALFVGSLAVAAICLFFQQFAYIAAPAIAYATAYIGLQRFRPIPFGDLSYGIYLFHYPIAITLMYAVDPHMHWYELFIAMMVATPLFAAGSWVLVEKPLLGRKRAVLGWIDRVIPERVQRLPILNPVEAPPSVPHPEPVAARAPVLQANAA